MNHILPAYGSFVSLRLEALYKRIKYDSTNPQVKLFKVKLHGVHIRKLKLLFLI